MADDILRDPSTGHPIQFNVPAPTISGGMESIDPAAIARAYQARNIEEAEKAVTAAIQFQGLRGYQQALQSGEPAAKALTRYGPMMFYQRPAAFGPAVRAVTPPKPAAPMIRAVPGGGFVRIDPETDAVKVIRQPTPTQPKPDKFSAAVGLDPLMMNPPSRLSMTEPQFRRFMETAPPQLKTNTINTTIERMLAPTSTATNAPIATAPVQFTTPEEVRAAFREKKLDRNAAKKILSEQFGMK